MKKFISIFLVLICMTGLSSCTDKIEGNVENVKVAKVSSEIYTDEEVEAALDVAKDYFKKHFSGCTLTEIEYVGDENLDFYQEFADRANADEVIVFISNFDVDDETRDDGLESNFTYENWNWILVRNNGGKWRHEDHGY